MMARPATRRRVLEATWELGLDGGIEALTMEAIAARAGAGKQTLYRSWSSPAAILFDALLDRSGEEVAIPDTGDLAADLELLVRGTIEELHRPGTERLLRGATALVVRDEELSDELRERLLAPQLRAVAARLAARGIGEPDEIAELLLGPILHRWLLRTRAFEPTWPREHVRRVLRATG